MLLVKFHSSLVLFLLLTGCATNRDIFQLDIPKSIKNIETSNKTVIISSITDKRVFEKNPITPNIPSLDPSEEQGEHIKKRAVGRKRNGFGKALGDILLSSDQDVEKVIKKSLLTAFSDLGIKVVNRSDVTTSTKILDVEIKKFWLWTQPSFSAITLICEISTDIEIKDINGVKKENASVVTMDRHKVVFKSDLIELIQNTILYYIGELKVNF